MEIVLEDGSLISSVSCTFEPQVMMKASDRDAFLDVWDKFKANNGKTMEFLDRGVKVSGFDNCTLAGTQTWEEDDGSLFVHFYFAASPQRMTDYAYEEAYKTLVGEVAADE